MHISQNFASCGATGSHVALAQLAPAEVNSPSSLRWDNARLPQGMSRERFADLVLRVARALPNAPGKAALGSFISMVKATRPSDWIVGSEEAPCCYVSQMELAHRGNVSSARIRAHEAELVAASLIEKRCMGNGVRSGFRRSGIYFGPAIARLAEFLDIDASIKAERDHIARLCGLRSTHKRQLKLCIEALKAQGSSSDENRLKDLQALYSALPRADRLSDMTIPALTAHVGKLAELVKDALAECQIPSKTSGPPHDFERSITEEQINTPNVICTISLEVEGPEINNSNNLETLTLTETGQSREKQDSLEKRSVDRQATDRPNPTNNSHSAKQKENLLKRLTPERLYNIASPEMQIYLGADRHTHGTLSFYSFELVAQKRLAELDISPSAWFDAVEAMGPNLATLCVLTIDANRNRSDFAVRNPGGYLRGLTRAYQVGKLNIAGSLLGLIKRGAQS